MKRNRRNNRRRLSARLSQLRRTFRYFGHREIIQLFDGKPLRRLTADGHYLGVDGKVYDD